MKVIGFANKFYTLWDITEETRPLGNGRNYVITHNTYIKNISIDKAAAFAKYPGVQFNECLRGMTRSWDSAPKEVWDNVDVFRFGKYAYEKIADNTDTNYLEWYWEQVSGDHKEYISTILKSRGYEIRTWGDGNEYLMSPEALTLEEMENKKFTETLAMVKSTNTLEVLIDANPDEDGHYRNGNVIYVFPEVKENYYNGFIYYLPVLNGKAKRIKNKTIIINDFNYELKNGNIYINIKNFNIKK